MWHSLNLWILIYHIGVNYNSIWVTLIYFLRKFVISNVLYRKKPVIRMEYTYQASFYRLKRRSPANKKIESKWVTFWLLIVMGKNFHLEIHIHIVVYMIEIQIKHQLMPVSVSLLMYRRFGLKFSKYKMWFGLKFSKL